MATVGLRELRRHASDLVRRAEAGEDVVVTVGGRPSVRIVPIAARRWRAYDDIADIFSGAPDEDWERDRDLVDHDPRDPWERR